VPDDWNRDGIQEDLKAESAESIRPTGDLPGQENRGAIRESTSARHLRRHSFAQRGRLISNILAHREGWPSAWMILKPRVGAVVVVFRK
jgi:hypothetical protein